ncbi:putative PPC domain, AT hook, DNA-binding protein [Medicago truncatula]|uniref:AT-hook motif nuclear-localized protein n=1 Tax=Medicago truncatula TaxID=3880 RepID=A0A396HKN9_MEDTR|nr:putative PPC domain, AT hook, DNA-binding protein [Medicago truncatula]
MDSCEPPHSPHPYQLQPKNIVPVGPNPFTNTSPITMITPTTAQFPLSNINTNPLPQYEHLSLMLFVGASSSGSGSFKRKRGRPRKYFPNGKITLGSSLDPTHAASFASPSSSAVKKNTSGRGRGRPRKYFPNGKITLGSSLDPTHAATFASPSSSAVKKNTSIRGKGKPRGSFKKKLPIEMSGVTNGSGFSPHVIIVNRGEDIVAKVGAFCQGGPNTDMCILSAHGLVGNAALYQSGSVVTYEVVLFTSF